MIATLIIPCYNEEENIYNFVELCKNTLSKYEKVKFEYIFINDGSTDSTQAVIEQIMTDNEELDITAICFSRNFGKEAAMIAGLDKSRGDFVSIIDADLQQNPKYIMEMIDFLLDNPEYDSVACYQESRKENIVTTFFKNGFYKLINYISDVKFQPNASDFRTLRRNVVDSILQVREYHRFSKGIFAWVGYKTKFIPYTAEKRRAGRTSWSFLGLIKYAKIGIVGFSTAPLKLAIHLGAVIITFSFIHLIYIIIAKLVFDSIKVPGYATIISLILFLSGIQIFLIGVIGEYLAQVFIQVKNRPLYIVKFIKSTRH